LAQEGIEVENLTIDEIMTELKVSRRTIQRCLKAGQFTQAFKIGTGKTSHWRIPRSDLENFKIRHQLSTGKEETIEINTDSTK